MKLFSTHNHSTGSDGKLSPEEIIKKAIKLGWSYICFTDHYHIPKQINNDYFNNFFGKKYIAEINVLKEKYKDKIEVCFGVELDWFEEHVDWTKNELKKENFDYVLGSIHTFPDKNGKYYSMENGKDFWLKTSQKFGGVKAYVTAYFNQIKKLVKSGMYDSVGHIDYIKLYNENNDLFSEDDEWYKKEVLEVLDLIKEKGMAIEINAGGLRKCKVQFPSFWIIKEAKKRNIPITIGLDAHYNEHYENTAIEKLIEIARQAGYKEIVRFKKRKMIKEKI